MKYIILLAVSALFTSCAENPFFLNYKGRFATYAVSPDRVIITPHTSAK